MSAARAHLTVSSRRRFAQASTGKSEQLHMKELLARFVAAFQRGIDGEVAAMRASAGAFEVTLSDGVDLGAMRYGFALGGGGGGDSGRVTAGSVCMLRTPAGDQTVTVERAKAGDGRVTLAASLPVDLAAPAALVVAPWFLYDRLRGALERLDPDQHGVRLALTLFGQVPPARAATTLRHEHDALDAVNARVSELLGPFEAFEVCPHDAGDGCACRKPAPGLLERACAEAGVDPTRAVMIGDIGADVQAAAAAGVRAVLVPTPETRVEEVRTADRVAPSLADAVSLVLEGDW
jgi:hypothetical protein